MCSFDWALTERREGNLPAELRDGGSVRKGTVLLFSRDSQGHLKGKADGHPLVEVKSDKLCQVRAVLLASLHTAEQG